MCCIALSSKVQIHPDWGKGYFPSHGGRRQLRWNRNGRPAERRELKRPGDQFSPQPTDLRPGGIWPAAWLLAYILYYCSWSISWPMAYSMTHQV